LSLPVYIYSYCDYIQINGYSKREIEANILATALPGPFSCASAKQADPATFHTGTAAPQATSLPAPDS
jgi:hypothetical protein